MIELARILPRERIRKTEKEGKPWEKQNNEIEPALSRYGTPHLTGVSDRICARQATPVFKIKRKDPCVEFINDCSSYTRLVTHGR